MWMRFLVTVKNGEGAGYPGIFQYCPKNLIFEIGRLKEKEVKESA
jgi:hypothetical protein